MFAPKMLGDQSAKQSRALGAHFSALHAPVVSRLSQLQTPATPSRLATGLRAAGLARIVELSWYGSAEVRAVLAPASLQGFVPDASSGRGHLTPRPSQAAASSAQFMAQAIRYTEGKE